MDTENCHLCNADTPYPSVSHESVPSLIDNLTYALYGLVTKTVLNGRVQWTIPCDPNSTGSIWGYTRNEGEGLMCYMLRVLQSTAPGLPPIGVNGQILVSLGGNAVQWRDSVVTQATTTFIGGFKLASANSDVSISTSSILALSTTGVAAGTFGSPTQWPVITVDSKGRISGASVQLLAITSAQIAGISASQVGTGLTSAQISGLSAAQVGVGLTSAQIAGISASQVGTGLTSAQISSISSAAIPASGVSAGSFGSSTQLSVLTVDLTGRITSATTIPHIVGNNASDLTTGTLNSARLPALSGDISLSAGTSVTTLATTGVSAGTFGSSAQIPVLTVDAKGRITAAASTPVLPGNNASDLTTGTLNPARLETSGVAAGSFGASTQIPVLTVDSKGRVTAAGSVTVRAGDNASDLTTGTLDPNRLATSGVSAGTFGTSSSVAQFTVDSKGRITSASNVGISGSAGGTVVSVGATSSTLSVSNTPIIYSGALQINLATTGISAITAGSSIASPIITVDTYGRVTSLSTAAINALTPSGVTPGAYGNNNSVARFTVNSNGIITLASQGSISAGAISDLAASATTDTTNASNISTGTLSSLRLPTSGVSSGTYGGSAQIPALTIDSTGRITSALSITPNFDRYRIVSTNNITMPTYSGSGPFPTVTFTWTNDGSVISWGPQAPITIVNSLAQYMVGSVSSYTAGTLGGVSTLVVSVFYATTPGAAFSSWTLHPGTRPVHVTDVLGMRSTAIDLLRLGGSTNLYQLLGDSTGIFGGAAVFNEQPTINAPTINGYTEGVVNVGNPVAGTANLTITAGTVLTATLASATPCTFTMPAVGAGKSFVLYLKQPSSGTPTTATFTPVTWSGAASPVITATLGRMDILSFVSDGVKWYGNFVQNFIY